MDWYRVKRGWKKVWYFIWEDDSWASWFVNIILAFVIIKFIVYPFLGLVLATSHPIVAVVSSSMEHDTGFDEWWVSKAICGEGSACTQEDYYKGLDINKEQFKGFSFRRGFNRGDIMVLYGTKPEKIEIGNVIVFKAERPDPIIHRVTSKKKENSHYVFTTKGDHNVAAFYFEAYIPEEDYIGRAVLRIPFLGYIKIGFVALLDKIGII
ncbi:MAG: signal peptidase I [Nanoarchaeota archaeon]|nr:signal peptidase I [Nanoarchaeota archaeon]